jgi:cytidylate kinase
MNPTPVAPITAARVPVIAIDGPTASGKGTIAARVAAHFGFHYLDSGAIYRITALAAGRAGVDLDHESAVAQVARGLDARFQGEQVLLAGQDVSADIRSEATGNAASRIAVFPAVRAALLERQQAFAQPPGLVADGRDMASVVFPQAALKVFLTASAQERANRRYKQLLEKGISVKFDDLLNDLLLRDQRDSNRPVAPLKPSADSWVLDSTGLDITAVVDQIVRRYQSSLT